MPTMNRKLVLQNLRETIDHIQSAIKGIEDERDEAFEAWIIFIYRDLNRAWNGREVKDCGLASADTRLCQFPTDLDVAD